MDLDRKADEAWILSVQRKLYQWRQANTEQSTLHDPSQSVPSRLKGNA
jgi:hypothetical protein